MKAFTLNALTMEQAAGNDAYLEFLRETSLSMGLYVLPAGSFDPQQPHTEDEVYVVMHGRGQLRIADKDLPVESGSVVFVAAGVEHRFHSITETLRVLVLFAPPEGSQHA